MADNLQKRPSKGILKNSSSFDKQDSHSNAKKAKETKWDEMNIIATLHPADKDYGFMKIDEPKTPYNYVDPDNIDGLNASELQEKIKLGADRPPKALQDMSEESEEDDDEQTPEDKVKKRDFESKRKKHYNEFYAVKLARKLLEEEDEDDDDDDDKNEDMSKKSSSASACDQSCSKTTN